MTQTASEAEAMTMNFHVTKRRKRKWKGTVQRKHSDIALQ